MQQRLLMPLAVVLALFPRYSARAEAPKPKIAPEANAAVKYWQAFGLLPMLDKQEEKILQDWTTAPINAEAVRLLEKSRNSLAQMRLGAKLPQCDWNLEYDDGVFMILQHGAKARSLARIAALDARHQFEQGHWAAGALDVTALLRMARHLEQDALMFIQIVGYGIERMAIEAAAPYLPELKTLGPDTISPVLAALPPSPTFDQMLKVEKQVGPIWMIQKLKAAEAREKGGWRASWTEVLDAIAAASDGTFAPNSEFLQSVTSCDQAVKSLERLLPLYDEMAKLPAGPVNGREARIQEFFASAKAANPLAPAFLPGVARVVAAGDRNKAEMELFTAAIAVARAGPGALKKFNDPFGDGPFQYRSLGKGFELKSQLIYQGAPVSLVVGQR